MAKKVATRSSDPFLLNYDAGELKIASEFLSSWLPYLSQGLCRRCIKTLSNRIRSIELGADDDLDVSKQVDEFAGSSKTWDVNNECSEEHNNCETNSVGSWKHSGDMNDNADRIWKDSGDMNGNEHTNSLGSWKDAAEETPNSVTGSSNSGPFSSSTQMERSRVKMSWADMAQEEELEIEGESELSSQLERRNGLFGEGKVGEEAKPKIELSREQREFLRFGNVKREKDYICFERVNGNANNECSEEHDNCETNSVGSWKHSGDMNDNADRIWKDSGDMNDNEHTNSFGSWKDAPEKTPKSVTGSSNSGAFSSSTQMERSRVKMSWADMAQEDELETEGENELSSLLERRNGLFGEGKVGEEAKPKTELSREQREFLRFRNVKREKDYICFERVNGKFVNILEGLELHTGVFSAAEQKRIVNFIEELQEKGKNGQLRARTYTAPQKWMRGKGRVTIQFGCCYNYSTDKNGNPPGILKNEIVYPLPPLFKVMIKRLVRWHVLPPSCVPDSCIINIYDEGDCIPPHVDNHDFVRPFCTVSFLSECDIVFGTNLNVVDAGVFAGSTAIPLPVGSVFVLNGNGADVAKHCVPAVPTKRISITFRRMDESKRPVGYVPEPDLQGLRPLSYESEKSKRLTPKPRHSSRKQENNREENVERGTRSTERSSESRHRVRGQRGPASMRRSQ